MRKTPQQKIEYERNLRDAKKAYLSGSIPTIRGAASNYSVKYETLRDRLKGRMSASQAHGHQQLLTAEQEKALERYIVVVDDWGHPLKAAHVKGFAFTLQPSGTRKYPNPHWISAFLKRHPGLASKFSQRLDRQRASAEDPVIIRDFFRKVSAYPA